MQKQDKLSVTLSEELCSRYAAILSEYFGENGYQPGRAISRGRFKQHYAEKYGCALSESDERLDAILSRIGVKRDMRLFPPPNAQQNELIAQIIAAIQTVFELGATAVYIEAVYDKYQQALAEHLQIYTPNALNTLLMAEANGQYICHYSKRYLYLTQKMTAADSAADLLRIMETFHQPQSYAAIHQKAWFIPYDKMKSLLSSIPSIVNVAPETYFYAPNLPISEEEQTQLVAQIQKELQEHSHMTDVRLRSLIQEKCSSIAINTADYTTYGLRNCLGYILQEHFAFHGPIISLKGKALRMSDVYAEFARAHQTLQLDDLTSFSAETNGGIIYWNAVLSEMIRVSATEFVRNDHLVFDTATSNAIDAVLEEICPGEYMPLKDIHLFLHFPNVGYPWNSYLLESYLFHASRKFRLLHLSFGKKGVYGAMVRVSSDITDYRALLLDVLLKSDALNSPQAALQYIVKAGYQQRRTYEGIETLIQEARLKKEQRENQKK